MSTGAARINPYFTSNRQQTRTGSTTQKSGGYRFQKQTSPDSRFSDTSSYKVCNDIHQTPTNYQLERVNCDVSADERVIKEVLQFPRFQSKPSDSSTNSSNLRKSPSFRLKNYRHITPGSKEQRQPAQRPFNNSVMCIAQIRMISQDARKNRMSALESFYQQLGTDEDINVSFVKNTQPVKKSGVMPTPSSSSQTTSVPKHIFDAGTLEEKDANIEEVHFFLVETQQKYKQWLENIEKKAKH